MSSYSDYCSKEPDYTFFRQVDYYWLFDKQLKFSKRPGFYLQDELEVKDYLKMKKINRKNLTKFLKRIQRNKKIEGVVDMSIFDS